MTDSEHETEETPQYELPEVIPQEGESYMQAYERMLREAAGVSTEDIENGETDVLGVLTGQVPMRSMPIAMETPEGIKGENLTPQPLEGEFEEDVEGSE